MPRYQSWHFTFNQKDFIIDKNMNIAYNSMRKYIMRLLIERRIWQWQNRHSYRCV